MVKDEIAREILAYLAEHPDAEDSLNGIVQWWILERRIKVQVSLVQEVLSELALQKKILEITQGHKTYFRLCRKQKSRSKEEVRAVCGREERGDPRKCGKNI